MPTPCMQAPKGSRWVGWWQGWGGLGPEQCWPAGLSGLQLLATVLSQKSISESSPGDSPVKPLEGSAGKARMQHCCLGREVAFEQPLAHHALSSPGAARSQPPVAHAGQVYAELPSKKLEPASEGKVQGLGWQQGGVPRAACLAWPQYSPGLLTG